MSVNWAQSNRLWTVNNGLYNMYMLIANWQCTLSLRINVHVLRWTWISQYQNVSVLWILSELRMIKVVVTTGAVDVKSSNHIVTTDTPTPSFLQAGCPSCCPTDSVKALKGKTGSGLLIVNWCDYLKRWPGICLKKKKKKKVYCPFNNSIISVTSTSNVNH